MSYREPSMSCKLAAMNGEASAEIEKRVELGPPVSAVLEPGWRSRAEDAIWAIINSPEMQFYP